MILDIVVYPDKRLKSISKKVEVFDDGLHRLLDDMYETMLSKNGIGLAAVQVGVARRILIVNIPREDEKIYKEDLLEIINPEIVEANGEVLFQEGCLSVPSFFEEVTRAQAITLKFFDRNGAEQTLKADGLQAIAIQHEIDHLNGIVFVEKLPMLKRKKFEKEWKKTHGK